MGTVIEIHCSNKLTTEINVVSLLQFCRCVLGGGAKKSLYGKHRVVCPNDIHQIPNMIGISNHMNIAALDRFRQRRAAVITPLQTPQSSSACTFEESTVMICRVQASCSPIRVQVGMLLQQTGESTEPKYSKDITVIHRHELLKLAHIRLDDPAQDAGVLFIKFPASENHHVNRP